jgi:hypothetical protein
MRLLILLIGLTASSSLFALELTRSNFSFTPASPLTVSPGPLTVDFSIDGLSPPGSNESVGAFEVDILFNESDLDFNATSSLADPDNEVIPPPSGISNVNYTPGSGVATFQAVTFDNSTTEANQSDAFRLAELDFNVTPTATGTTSLDFQVNQLRDTTGAAINVIPEPGTWLGAVLAGAGLIGVVRWRRQRLGT